MKLRIRGADLYLSFGLLPLLIFCIITGETRTLIAAGISLLLHELAHWIAARNLGYRIDRLSVYPFGAVMDLSAERPDPRGEWIVAAAGPLGSFVSASGLRFISELLQTESVWVAALVRANFMIAILNLMPAFPLDGGRIAKCVLLCAARESTADRILFAVTCAVSAGVASCGIYLISRGIPAWMMPATAVFLTLAAWREVRKTGRGNVAPVLERRMRLHEGKAQKATLLVIRDDATIGEALSDVSHRYYTVVRVIGEMTCFETDEDALLNAAAEHGYLATLRTAFREKSV